MPIIDVIFLVVLTGFALFGFWFGLIHTLGSLVGTLAGVFLSSRWYESVAEWAQSSFSGSINVWRVISFIVLFLIVNRLIGILFDLLEKTVGILAKLPILNSINKLAGGVLGLIEGAVILGAFIFMIGRFPFDLGDKILNVSILKTWFLSVFDILLPLLPEALKIVENLPI